MTEDFNKQFNINMDTIARFAGYRTEPDPVVEEEGEEDGTIRND